MLTYFVVTGSIMIEVSLDEFNRLNAYLKLNKIQFILNEDEDKSLRTNKIIILN